MQLHAVCVPLSNIMVRFVHQKSEAAKKMRMRKWGKARHLNAATLEGLSHSGRCHIQQPLGIAVGDELEHGRHDVGVF